MVLPYIHRRKTWKEEDQGKHVRAAWGGFFGFVLFLIVAAVGVIAAVKYMPSRERADLDALYAAGGSDRVALYLNYERQEESGVYVDGQTYLPAAWVDSNLNERFTGMPMRKYWCTPCRRRS